MDLPNVNHADHVCLYHAFCDKAAGFVPEGRVEMPFFRTVARLSALFATVLHPGRVGGE